MADPTENDRPLRAGPGNRPGPRGWLLMSPLLAWLLLFVVIPNAILVAYSLARRAGVGGVIWEFSAAGYRQVLEPVSWRILLHSLDFAFWTTLLCALAGYPVAFFIGKASPGLRAWLLLGVMIPFWTSFLIRMTGWVVLLGTHGLINTLLLSAHVIDEPLDMLYTPGAELLGLVYTFLPFMILPIYGSVEKLDDSLIEAAADLGAGPVRSFFRVILPLTLPGVAAGCLLVFIPAVGTFAVSEVLGGNRRPMIGNLIEQQFVGKGGDWPFGSALGVVLLAGFIGSYMLVRWLAVRLGGGGGRAHHEPA